MQNIKSELREIWNYRHLLQMMVTRDLKTRYQRSVLGVAWSFLQPLGMMIVMTFAFTVLNPSNIPRAHVFILSGLLAWNFLARQSPLARAAWWQMARWSKRFTSRASCSPSPRCFLKR